MPIEILPSPMTRATVDVVVDYAEADGRHPTIVVDYSEGRPEVGQGVTIHTKDNWMIDVFVVAVAEDEPLLTFSFEYQFSESEEVI